MKTPEEMTEDYADRIERQAILCVSLLAMNDGEYFAAKKAYKAGYKAAEPQWISVNERLPEVGAPCLVTCHEERYTIAEYDGIKWTTLNSIAYYHPIVTHWQELSELPKEEA